MIKLFFALCFLALAGWIYQRRAAFEPAFVWYEVYENGGLTNKTVLPQITGEAKFVLDGRTFHLKGAKGKLIAVRLAGLKEPPPPTTRPAIEVEARRRDLLKSMILSNTVRVEVTYSNLNSILGIVHCQGANINTRLIARNMAELNPDYIKPLHRQSQYDFFYARRLAAKTVESSSEKTIQLGAK